MFRGFFVGGRPSLTRAPPGWFDAKGRSSKPNHKDRYGGGVPKLGFIGFKD